MSLQVSEVPQYSAAFAMKISPPTLPVSSLVWTMKLGYSSRFTIHSAGVSIYLCIIKLPRQLFLFGEEEMSSGCRQLMKTAWGFQGKGCLEEVRIATLDFLIGLSSKYKCLPC